MPADQASLATDASDSAEPVLMANYETLISGVWGLMEQYFTVWKKGNPEAAHRPHLPLSARR